MREQPAINRRDAGLTIGLAAGGFELRGFLAARIGALLSSPELEAPDGRGRDCVAASMADCEPLLSPPCIGMAKESELYRVKSAARKLRSARTECERLRLCGCDASTAVCEPPSESESLLAFFRMLLGFEAADALVLVRRL